MKPIPQTNHYRQDAHHVKYQQNPFVCDRPEPCDDFIEYFFHKNTPLVQGIHESTKEKKIFLAVISDEVI